MWWTGGHYPGTSKTIVEVETDAGLTGSAKRRRLTLSR